MEGSLLMGSVFMSDDVDDMVMLSGVLDVMYTNELALGLRVEAGFGGDDLYAALVEARYHFLINENAVPYAGAVAGPAMLHVDGDTDPAFKTGVFGGLKYYVNPLIALFAEMQFGGVYGDETATYAGLFVGVSAKL